MTNIIITLLASILISTAQVYTNGSYFQSGQTIEVDKNIHTISNEFAYFSNELLVKTEGELTINSFFQEIYQSNAPSKIKIGNHSLSATILNGTSYFSFLGASENSSCVISTPLADLELKNGNFYVKVNENKLLVVVVDGSLRAHNGKKEFDIHRDSALIAVPNEIGILEDKISLSVEKVRPETLKKFVDDFMVMNEKRDSILFARINSKTVGIIIH